MTRLRHGAKRVEKKSRPAASGSAFWGEPVAAATCSAWPLVTRCGSRLCIAASETTSICAGRVAILVYRDHSRWQTRLLFWPLERSPRWLVSRAIGDSPRSTRPDVCTAAAEFGDQLLPVNKIRFLGVLDRFKRTPLQPWYIDSVDLHAR